MSDRRRLATELEVKEAKRIHLIRFPDDDVEKRHSEALKEGYKDEICLSYACGATYLAFHHLCRCPRDDCNMKSEDKRSILQQMQDSLKDDL